jgi:membrane protein implicated in regulation of membrane protease activity
LPGIGTHLINPRTGRPQPNSLWTFGYVACLTLCILALGFAALAAFAFAVTGALDLAFQVTIVGGVQALMAYACLAAIRRRKRRYREALAAYEAALANAADWNKDEA